MGCALVPGVGSATNPPPFQSLTARTGIAERPGSISTSWCGDACSASVSKRPEAALQTALRSRLTGFDATWLRFVCTIENCDPAGSGVAGGVNRNWLNAAGDPVPGCALNSVYHFRHNQP